MITSTSENSEVAPTRSGSIDFSSGGLVDSSNSFPVADGPRSVGFYRRRISPHLQPEVFLPNGNRLLTYGFCALISISSYLLIVFMPIAWWGKLGLGLAIGLANGTLGFISHELLHGSITKNERLQNVLGFFGTLPFFISPTFWKFSHNRLHHAKTQQLIKDPDAFPNLRIYRNSRFVQLMFPFTPGSGCKRSLLYFFFWFSFHNVSAQIKFRFRNKIYDLMDHRRVSLEFTAQLLIGATLLAVAGPSNWLWVFLLPLAVQNYLLMSYISTNHNLSPLTSDNDPLMNSLSVTNHPLIEALNLNFGYHVEHHIFPTVSGKHAKLIHRELLRQFPETYKVMPKWKAMRNLYQTARIYKNGAQLIHPETLETFSTL